MTLRQKLFAVMAIPAVVLFAATFLAHRANVRQRESIDLVRLTYEIRSRIDDVVQELSGAESSVRGFMITDDPALLLPYQHASSSLDRPLRDLNRLVVDAQARELLSRLEELTTERMDRLAELTDLAPMVPGERPQLEALMSEGNGVMVEVRRAAEELQDREDTLLAERAADLVAAERSTFLIQLVIMPVGMLVAGMVVLGFERRLLRRIDSLTENIGRLERGLPLVGSQRATRDELDRLEQTFTATGTKVMELRTELERIATVDALTGLLNRHGFLPLAAERLVSSSGTTGQLAMLFIDVDGLKLVNDSLGHAVGDELIAECGSLIRDTFRADDLLARIGGDEFCVLVSTGSDEGSEAARTRLHHAIEIANRLPGRAYRISASIGVAGYDAATDRSVDDLLRRADAQMYEEKRQRRRVGIGADL